MDNEVFNGITLKYRYKPLNKVFRAFKSLSLKAEIKVKKLSLPTLKKNRVCN